MAIATFYHPTLALTDTSVQLSATESAHAIKSRRLGLGSAIQLINGRGLLAQASISATSKRAMNVEIESIEKHALTYSLTIATAIPKGDRQRTMVEMLTQIGVTEILPLRCERSVTQYKSTMLDKWQRYAIEACKQSQNLWLPTILPESSIEGLLATQDSKIIFADSEGQSVLTLDKTRENELTVLIGPEGGFSKQEMSLLSNSCLAVNFGSNILRTELASIIAATQVRLINS